MTLSYLYSKFIKKLHGHCILRSDVDKKAAISVNCNVVDCVIGKYTYIGHDSHVIRADIGSFCSISDHVFIGGDEHPMDWVSTSPVFENVGGLIKKRFKRFDIPLPKRTVIGSDVWIGHGAIIKAGVRVGHGAIIGAGSVVTKNVLPYTIVAGIPSRVIRKRFDEETIKALLEVKWWEFSDDIISKAAEFIKNPKDFLYKINLLHNMHSINNINRGGVNSSFHTIYHSALIA